MVDAWGGEGEGEGEGEGVADTRKFPPTPVMNQCCVDAYGGSGVVRVLHKPVTFSHVCGEAQARANRLAAEWVKTQADAKEYREHKKNNPVEQAKKLALALQKELATLHVMQLDVAGSRATNDQKTPYKKKFETFGNS